MPTFHTHTTPNPNSLKITTDADSFIDDGMKSFNSAQEAEDDALGKRLFGIPGVANVFILPQFVTITKHPATEWEQMMPKVKSALAEYFEQR